MGEPLILVAGTPGTGKTSVGKALAGILGCSMLESSEVMKRLGAARPDPTGRHTMVVDPEMGVRAAREAARGAGGCTLVATLYPSLWMEAVEDMVAFILLLRTHPRILCKRLAQRGWPEAKVAENCAAEALGVVASEVREWWHMTVEVDTSHTTPKEAGLKALGLVEEWRTGVYIDWLSLDEGLVEDLTRWLSGIDLDEYRGGE
ncbi:MAG: AAA family ATPase [Desulfurococcales archaeon]|nr:AAA family ATPase [Desulfurococcales archaeon]